MRPRSPLSGRHRVAVAMAICASVVLTSIGVSVASTRLTNSHAVQAASAVAGLPAGYFNASKGAGGTVGFNVLLKVPSGKGLAISQITVQMLGGTGSTSLTVNYYVIPTAADWAHPVAGSFKSFLLRTLTLPVNTTLGLNWSNPALSAPAPSSGKKGCLGFTINIASAGAGAIVAVTGRKI
jgi:hypothetical protein